MWIPLPAQGPIILFGNSGCKGLECREPIEEIQSGKSESRSRLERCVIVSRSFPKPARDGRVGNDGEYSTQHFLTRVDPCTTVAVAYTVMRLSSVVNVSGLMFGHCTSTRKQHHSNSRKAHPTPRRPTPT
jgi:hypothetical protein